MKECEKKRKKEKGYEKKKKMKRLLQSFINAKQTQFVIIYKKK